MLIPGCLNFVQDKLCHEELSVAGGAADNEWLREIGALDHSVRVDSKHDGVSGTDSCSLCVILPVY